MPIIAKTCPVCEGRFKTWKRESREKRACGLKCAVALRSLEGKVRKKQPTKWRRLICRQCRKPYRLPKSRKPTKHCSYTCSATARWRSAAYRAKVGAAMSRKSPRQISASSEHMKRLNKDPVIRERSAAAVRGKPFSGIQGGNGRGMTKPESMLSKALGWSPLIVPVGNRPGYPTHYKVDIGNAMRKVAIEVDGATHLARKVIAADRRKESFVKEAGWVVLRFKNQEVLTDLSKVVASVLKACERS